MSTEGVPETEAASDGDRPAVSQDAAGRQAKPRLSPEPGVGVGGNLSKAGKRMWHVCVGQGHIAARLE